MSLTTVTTTPIPETVDPDYVWTATDHGSGEVKAIVPADGSTAADFDVGGEAATDVTRLGNGNVVVTIPQTTDTWEGNGDFSGDVGASLLVLQPIEGSEPEHEVLWFYEASKITGGSGFAQQRVFYDHIRDRIVYACNNSNGTLIDGTGGSSASIVVLPANGGGVNGRYTDPVLWFEPYYGRVQNMAMTPDGHYVFAKEYAAAGQWTVAKYDGDGNIIWQWISTTAGSTNIWCDVDDDGNILVAGIQSTGWYDKPIADGGQVNTLGTNANIWLLDANGVVQWSHLLDWETQTSADFKFCLFEKIGGDTTDKILVCSRDGTPVNQLSVQGDFTPNTNWSAGTGWALNGNATWTQGSGDGDLTYTDYTIQADRVYRLQFTISGQSGAAQVVPSIGATTAPARSANGTYHAVIRSTDATDLTFSASGGSGALSIDNVSLYHLEGPLWKLDISDPESIATDWEYNWYSTTATETSMVHQENDGDIWVGIEDITEWWDPQATGPTLDADGKLPDMNMFKLTVTGTLDTDFNASSNQDGTAEIGSNTGVFGLTFETPPATPARTRATWVVASTGGNIVLIDEDLDVVIPTSGLGAAPGWSVSGRTIVPSMQYRANKVYIVDGEVAKILDLSTATPAITDWTPTAGTLPTKPRLVALYRDRMVMAGVLADPSNYFMSRSGDPLDFDYTAATTDALRAVIGTNTPVAGLPGDAINTLVNYRDDILIFGCEHSIYFMTGDPAYRGAVDLITDEVGTAFGQDVWTIDPFGAVYFASNIGIIRMTPDGQWVNIADNKIKRQFEQIDHAANRYFIMWDNVQDGLHVLAVPINPTSVTKAFFWERKTAAWWNDTFTDAIRPQCLHGMKSPNPSVAYPIMGCADGYVRKWDRTASDDDGNDIDTEVSFGPFVHSDTGRKVFMSNIQVTMGNDSGAVDLKLYQDENAEDLFDTAAVSSWSMNAGRNRNVVSEISGGAVGFSLSADTSTAWALESIRVDTSLSATTRKALK